MKSIFALLLIAVALMGCGTLDSSGTYKGDRVAYVADSTITSSYEVIHAFVKWEYDNRQTLAAYPEIKQTADYFRKNARRWIQMAISARESYSKEPTPENKTRLQVALDLLTAAVAEAQRYKSQPAN